MIRSLQSMPNAVKSCSIQFQGLLSPFCLRKLDDEADDEGKNGQSIGYCDADKHSGLNLTRCFWVAADCFKSATNQKTEADTRTDHTEADSECHTECFCCYWIHTEIEL